jgi:hypothetical protein
MRPTGSIQTRTLAADMLAHTMGTDPQDTGSHHMMHVSLKLCSGHPKLIAIREIHTRAAGENLAVKIRLTRAVN